MATIENFIHLPDVQSSDFLKLTSLLKLLFLVTTGCNYQLLRKRIMNMLTLFPQNSHPHLLRSLKQWLDQLKIHDRQIAHRIAELIPAQCPFERNITLFRTGNRPYSASVQTHPTLPLRYIRQS